MGLGHDSTVAVTVERWVVTKAPVPWRSLGVQLRDVHRSGPGQVLPVDEISGRAAVRPERPCAAPLRSRSVNSETGAHGGRDTRLVGEQGRTRVRAQKPAQMSTRVPAPEPAQMSTQTPTRVPAQVSAQVSPPQAGGTVWASAVDSLLAQARLGGYQARLALQAGPTLHLDRAEEPAP